MPHFGSNGSFTFYNRTHNNVAARAKCVTNSSALQTLKDIKSHQINLRTRGKEKALMEMGEKICKESNKPNIVSSDVDGVDLKKLRCVEYAGDMVHVNSVQTNSSQKIKSLCKNVETISKIHQKDMKTRSRRYSGISTRSIKQQLANRPKRNILPKQATSGLLWKEEADLEKALRASIQDNRSKELTETTSSTSDIQSALYQRNIDEMCSWDSSNFGDASSTASGDNWNKFGDKRCGSIRAHRKFASGSLPESLDTTPSKNSRNAPDLRRIVSNKPSKTEDFLTFLCLRKAPSLPSHLEYFKYPESETFDSFPNSVDNSLDGSFPATPVSICPSVETGEDLTSSSYNLARRTDLSDASGRNKSADISDRITKNKKFSKSTSESALRSHLRRKKCGGGILHSSDSDVESSSNGASTKNANKVCQKNVLSESKKRTVSKRDESNRQMQKSRSAGDIKIRRTLSEKSLKSRLRPSTKVVTAALEIEQLMLAEQKLSSSSASSDPAEWSGDSSESDTGETAAQGSSTGRQQSKSIRKRKLGKVKDDSEDECPAVSKVRESEILEAPLFSPTADEFSCPLDYIRKISTQVGNHGMCRIVPPDGWQLDCSISQQLRFTPHTQYVHQLYKRWGPNVQQTSCIAAHLESQGGNFEQSPLVGGVEVDLLALSNAIKSNGGLQRVIDKNLWPNVIKMLRVPKIAQDKFSRFYEIYCRYLLSYDTMSAEEKAKLEKKVQSKWNKEKDGCIQPCMVKSRSKTLSEFYCMARNMTSMFFDDEPTSDEVTFEYWQIVEQTDSHVAVQMATVDMMDPESGVSTRKDGGKQKLDNLKTLLQTDDAILDHLRSINGFLQQVLHINMLFSTSCWTRDSHFLGLVYYIHTGADIVWYSAAKSEEAKMKAAFKKFVPDLIEKDLAAWLPSDTVMITPDNLGRHGVNVSRTTQQHGQFVVVFPGSFYSNISCGYNVSEHVSFMTSDWLESGNMAAQILKRSHVAEQFSFDQVLTCLIAASGISAVSLQMQTLTLFEDAVSKELNLRKKLTELGLKVTKSIANNKVDRLLERIIGRELDRCEISQNFCFWSMVKNDQDDTVLCLDCAVDKLAKRKNLNPFQLVIFFQKFELQDLINKARNQLPASPRASKKKS